MLLRQVFPFLRAGIWKRCSGWRGKCATVPIAALARAKKQDVEAAIEALEPAAAPRLHIFLATSDLHLRVKLNMTREQALEAIRSMIRLGRNSVGEVEFSAEDAGRTDIGFLCQVCQVAVDAGATVLNLPDTVGYAVPDEYGAMFEQVRAHLDDPQGITLSAHCHDDLGLAVANSLAAVRAGVRQIECTVNGIGERAGNAALEEIAVALAVRKESFGVTTNIKLDELFRSSRMLTEITGARGGAEQGGCGCERVCARSWHPPGRNHQEPADVRDYVAGIGGRAFAVVCAGETFGAECVEGEPAHSRL